MDNLETLPYGRSSIFKLFDTKGQRSHERSRDHHQIKNFIYTLFDPPMRNANGHTAFKAMVLYERHILLLFNVECTILKSFITVYDIYN